METLYDFLFHYNIYEDLWYCFKREDSSKYFNGELNDKQLYKSKDIMNLVEYISKNETK